MADKKSWVDKPVLEAINEIAEENYNNLRENTLNGDDSVSDISSEHEAESFDTISATVNAVSNIDLNAPIFKSQEEESNSSWGNIVKAKELASEQQKLNENIIDANVGINTIEYANDFYNPTDSFEEEDPEVDPSVWQNLRNDIANSSFFNPQPKKNIVTMTDEDYAQATQAKDELQEQIKERQELDHEEEQTQKAEAAQRVQEETEKALAESGYTKEQLSNMSPAQAIAAAKDMAKKQNDKNSEKPSESNKSDDSKSEDSNNSNQSDTPKESDKSEESNDNNQSEKSEEQDKKEETDNKDNKEEKQESDNKDKENKEQNTEQAQSKTEENNTSTEANGTKSDITRSEGGSISTDSVRTSGDSGETTFTLYSPTQNGGSQSSAQNATGSSTSRSPGKLELDKVPIFAPYNATRRKIKTAEGIALADSATLKRYYSSIDAEIYFGNEYVEEVCDINYSVSQSSIPIYGFNSYTYDDIAIGSRVVQGQFAIRFISPNYLFRIIDEAVKGSITSMASFAKTTEQRNTLLPKGSIDSRLLGSFSSDKFNQLYPDNGFDIDIIYGGKSDAGNEVHIVLEDVHILSCTSGASSSSPVPVTEQYSFIAKDIKTVAQ